MSGIDKQLKKGVLNILILKMINRKDMYGYELIQIMDEKSNGYFKLKEGSLYPVLYRLEDEGLIESYWNQEPYKRTVPRKYYKITKKGKAVLKVYIEEWNDFLESTKSILKGDE
ncbi:DNA-binding transcriptional regulator, PadR family [Proteiniborus ethanoligenes]|uniref:DNA-binding transcriptional regulator, PadR family n=1 Tax=Proteiniborus ethanoligenes TaxID=415015 RepID=A0A1H3RRQ0_9FIRM|nr:PadR family transcriptional regulator [Proteiniborus ethanoligenes]SDZ27881.1 DNA-binding transcriptional regulator, PadR family [Proteiniborus ethanoligenes]